MTITARHAQSCGGFRGLRPRLTAVTLLVVSLQTAGSVSAQQRGDTITFALPAGTDVTLGPDGDKVIYSGRPFGYGDAQSCASDPDLRPMQPVMLVDAGSGSRATRSQGMVTLYINGSFTAEIANGVRNGTRIGNLTGPEDCEIDGLPYYRYTGIIE